MSGVGLERIASLKREITNLRCEKILATRQYEAKLQMADHYRDRRAESRIAVYTRKINKLIEIRERYEQSHK
jgi:hypothetical protein